MLQPDLRTGIPPRKTRKTKGVRPRRFVGLVCYLLAFALLLVLAIVVYPSFQYVDRPLEVRPRLVYRGEVHEFPVVLEREEAYVPLRFIQRHIDPSVFWDESGVMVITTKDKVVKLSQESLTAYVNQHPVTVQFPVILEGNEPYVPASTLEILYPVFTAYSHEAGIFLVKSLSTYSTTGELGTDAVLRNRASFLSRRVHKLQEGEEVTIYHLAGKWLKVETSVGHCGYLTKNQVINIREEPPVVKIVPGHVPSPLKGDKVVLVWEQVDSITPDPSNLPDMPGLNVVSPTWFHLSHAPGEIENRADLRYVNWAHSRDHQVWALFSNSFDPDITSMMLRDSSLRDQIISQLLIYANIYKLDGINIDFENVYLADGPYLTQFVRELTPMLHNIGLTVSIDVTVKSSSPTWSRFLERDRLAEVVDYVMLMAYDQYPQGSKVSGPVSSIPWTEWAINKTLEEVPREKLVLGVPFYTRRWTESSQDGAIKVTSSALGMESAERWLKQEGLTPEYQTDTGLLYAEKRIGEETLKIWLENTDSIQKRIHLVKNYALAGMAAWRRGFETPDIWQVIDDNFD